MPAVTGVALKRDNINRPTCGCIRRKSHLRSWLLIEQFSGRGFFVTKLFIGNLSFQATEADLTSLFSQYGAVENVSVMTDRMTGQSRGFAFIEMSDRKQAESAIAALNGTDLQGRA